MFETCLKLTMRNQNSFDKVVLVFLMLTWNMLTHASTVSTSYDDHQDHTVGENIEPMT